MGIIFNKKSACSFNEYSIFSNTIVLLYPTFLSGQFALVDSPTILCNSKKVIAINALFNLKRTIQLFDVISYVASGNQVSFYKAPIFYAENEYIAKTRLKPPFYYQFSSDSPSALVSFLLKSRHFLNEFGKTYGGITNFKRMALAAKFFSNNSEIKQMPSMLSRWNEGPDGVLNLKDRDEIILAVLPAYPSNKAPGLNLIAGRLLITNLRLIYISKDLKEVKSSSFSTAKINVCISYHQIYFIFGDDKLISSPYDYHLLPIVDLIQTFTVSYVNGWKPANA